jgi:hypothetical protein
MNEEICCLKRGIQEKMEKVIKMAKYHPKLRSMISRLLEEELALSVEDNLKVGKVGAMKAQRRLIEARQREEERMG